MGLSTDPLWACLQIRHELLRPVPPWFLQQLGRPVGNPPYHPDGPPWLAGLGLHRWYTHLVYPQQRTQTKDHENERMKVKHVFKSSGKTYKWFLACPS
jgi:hypothetical protein